MYHVNIQPIYLKSLVVKYEFKIGFCVANKFRIKSLERVLHSVYSEMSTYLNRITIETILIDFKIFRRITIDIKLTASQLFYANCLALHVFC